MIFLVLGYNLDDKIKLALDRLIEWLRNNESKADEGIYWVEWLYD